MGGNCIVYPGIVSTDTDEVMKAKILFNSFISTKGETFGDIDIINSYLGTPMPHYEYMWLPYDIIPDEIKEKYNLQALKHNERICIEI